MTAPPRRAVIHLMYAPMLENETPELAVTTVFLVVGIDVAVLSKWRRGG